MRVLVFGKSGQVAKELQRHMPTGIHSEFLGRDQVDVAYAGACAAAIMQSPADVVINATAWTAVDKAESEPDAAWSVNARAPGEMVEACNRKNIPLIHLSTDYVFAGTGGSPQKPDSPRAALNVYGKSKAAGETAISARGGNHLVLRTSWVFSSSGNNFVKTMLKLGLERKQLRIVSDQIGGPTSASAIAVAIIKAAEAMHAGAPGGLHHFAGTPDTSWSGFAREIFRQASLDVQVDNILTTDYPTPAKRPLNSRLCCKSFNNAFGIERPDWRAGLAIVLQELGVSK